MKAIVKILAVVLALLLVVAIDLWLHGQRPVPPAPEPQRDTVWVKDTVTILKPVPVTKWLKDTVLVPVVTPGDTIHERDTLFVPIPIETTYYRDSLYEAWVTGYKATLDSLHLFQNIQIIEERIPVYIPVKKRWGIGVQAGVTYIPKEGVIPYVGFGASYNLISF